MNKKHLASDLVLIAIIAIVTYLGYEWIYVPFVTTYNFETITKVSSEYSNPIYITFHWVTEDELQVGKDIDVDATVKGLPYLSTNKTLEKITIEFDEIYLNFWDADSNEPLSSNLLLLEPNWNENSFNSKPIKIRFIIPTDIPAEFCDYNIPKCFEIPNIIHPAPHDLAVQLQTNRIGLGISFMLAVLSSVIVWSRIRFDSK